MNTESDLMILEDPASRTPAQPGIRATLRALVGRLGAPDITATQGLGFIPPPLTIHGFGPVLTDWETGARETPAEEEETVPARQAAAARARRQANAHAAYGSVEGTHAAALDAALAVIEADYAVLRARCATQAEALKQLRLYAHDPAIRALAAKGLDDTPECPGEARSIPRGPARTGAYHA